MVLFLGCFWLVINCALNAKSWEALALAFSSLGNCIGDSKTNPYDIPNTELYTELPIYRF